MSSNGKYQSAVDGLGDTFSGGKIYISHNYGKDWVGIESTNLRYWNNVSCSSNGKYQLAVTYYSNYYVSSDYGNTWTVGTTEIVGSIDYCSVSATGQYQFLFVSFPQYGIYKSSDYGNTWTIYDEFKDVPDEYIISSLSSQAQNQVFSSQNSIIEIFVDAYRAKK
jgi:photosystem II stability/assembly factor-like uncharacterized protein